MTAAPPTLDRNWPLVAAGALMTCVAIGVVFSLAVFLDPMGADTGWPRAGISAAMTFAFLAMGFAGFGWGTLSDRWGPRRVVVCGVLLLGLANILASRAPSLLAFQLTFGVLIGVAAGAFFAPIIAATTVSFDKRRGLAVALVSAGMGVAPMTIAPLAAWLVTHYGWRQTMLGIGVGAWVVLLPFVRFIRVVPLPAGPRGAAADTGELSAREALRSRAFIVLAGAFFACCAAHSGPIFHTVSYAIGCGLPMVAAVTIYSMEGAAGLLVQAFAAVSYLAVNQLAGFYGVALVFGATYGGTMPLYAALARQAFNPRILGTVLGAATLLSSTGMALGPFIGGWLYDRFGSYVWLYTGSMLVGLAAAGIAMTFPRGAAVARLRMA